MASSAKKKKEKKKDFQKPKLKVGKVKPKASNFTDTSFKAKSIVLKKQSISTTAPSSASQFAHHLSLLRSKSENQRSESLAFLTNAISSKAKDAPLPEPTSAILAHVQPLIVDGSPAVRRELLRLLKVLQENDVARHPDQILLYTRVGMTHLSADIRLYSLDILDWLLQAAGEQVVSCAGGWMKTLKCFEGLLGWDQSSTPGSWSSYQHSTTKPGRDVKTTTKQIATLASVIRTGIQPPSRKAMEEAEMNSTSCWPYWHLKQHLLPERSNAFAHLNLFGSAQDEHSAMLQDRHDRLAAFEKHFMKSFRQGVEEAKKEGGEIGRAAAGLGKAIEDGMGI